MGRVRVILGWGVYSWGRNGESNRGGIVRFLGAGEGKKWRYFSRGTVRFLGMGFGGGGGERNGADDSHRFGGEAVRFLGWGGRNGAGENHSRINVGFLGKGGGGGGGTGESHSRGTVRFLGGGGGKWLMKVIIGKV